MQRMVWLLALYFCAFRLLLIGYALWPLATAVHHHVLATINLACKFGFLGETIFCRFIDTTAPPAQYTHTIQTKFLGLGGLASGATEIAPLTQSLTEVCLSVDDLIVVVRLSTLTSRATLVEELLMISSETKEVSCNLQKLSAKIQATVDMYVFPFIPKQS